MDIHQLRYFVAVAEELHFGRAAERLMVTPSPLSKQIRRLEREFGGDLLIREHHSVHLTPLGQQVLEPIREILAKVDALKTFRTERAGQLRVGATPLAPADIIDETIERLHDMLGDHPIELTLSPTSVLLPLLASRKLDFAIVYRPVPAARFASLDLASYDTFVAMTHDDPLAQREQLWLTDLVDAPLVVSTYDFHPEHMRARQDRLRDAGITNLVEVSNGHPAIVAANVRLNRARALVLDTPDNPVRAAFGSSEFALVPLAAGELRNFVAFAALQSTVDEGTLISKILRELSGVLQREREEAGGADAPLAVVSSPAVESETEGSRPSE